MRPSTFAGLRNRILAGSIFFALSCGRGPSTAVSSSEPYEADTPIFDSGPGDSPGPYVDVSDSCSHVSVEARCREGYCLIPAGCFIMGSPSDEPFRGRYTEQQHEVTLTHSFAMQQHELTQEQWTSFGFPNLAGTMDNIADGKDCIAPSCPATTMTWFEAVKYANKKSDQHGLQRCIELEGCTGEVGVDFQCTGYRQTTPSYYACNGYRLPTHAEFQYAIKAGTRTAFYSGPFEPSSDQCIEVPHLNDTAWYCVNSGKRTHPVKQKEPNPWGLHDMMGNVMEYVASNPDLFELQPRPVTDPFGELSQEGIFGMFGGPYFGWPALLRSANQSGAMDVVRLPRDKSMGPALGFRLVRTLTEEEAANW